MKTYIVIGLGRFGTSVATRLYELGNEVLAIDAKEENIQQISDRVTHAAVGDARDEAVLRALGVRNFECAIVAIGEDLAASILITLTLKELGVPAVICKASNEAYKRALEKVGADRVVIPEREMAAKLAQNLSCSNIQDFIELSDTYGIADVAVPESWVGKIHPGAQRPGQIRHQRPGRQSQRQTPGHAQRRRPYGARHCAGGHGHQ